LHASVQEITVIFLALFILITYLLMRVIECDTPVIRVWCFVWGVSAAGGAAIEPSTMFELFWAYLFILCLTLSLVAGVTIAGGSGKQPKLSEGRKILWEQRLPERLHSRILYAILIPGYVSVFLLVNELGLDVSSISNIESIVASIAAISYSRYTEDYNPEALTRFMLVFVYLSGAIVGWYSLRNNVKKITLKIVLSVIPALLWVIILTTKAALLFWLVFYISARMSFMERGAADKLSVTKYVFIGLFLSVFFFIVQLARYGGDFQTEGLHVINVLMVAGIGHIFAFREWFESYAVFGPSNFGHHTFAGIFELLGEVIRGQGLGYGNVSVAGFTTNVYSALRNIVEDFGVVVSVSMFSTLGVAATILMKHQSLTSRSTHFAIVAWLIFSPFTSIYNYNSLIFAAILLVVIGAVLDLMRPLVVSRVYILKSLG
jgi:oligosaccharide repeat unit polymerase